MKINKLTLLITLMILCAGCVFTFNKYDKYRNMKNSENESFSIEALNYEAETTMQVTETRNYVPDEAESVEASYNTVKSINSDIIGWLSFPSVGLNVPLLKGSDNDFYLKHSYNKQFTWSGSIFMDYRLPSDFSAQNTMIYGHHMPDGSAFTNLFCYEDKSFYDSSDNKIYIYTQDKTYVYQIFSVAEVEAGTIYTKRVFKTVSFSDFISAASKASMYSTGVDATDDDKIISLITCLTDSSSHMRLIIYAKLINILQN